MAQEIIRWCDVCLEADERHVGQLISVAFNGKAARDIDLCTEHVKALVEPLDDALNFLRGRSSSTSSSVASIECFVCGASYASQTGFKSHIATKHNAKSQAELFGSDCASCGQANQSFVGLRNHVGQTHHLSLAESFALAKQSGDQYNVVARRIEVVSAAK